MKKLSEPLFLKNILFEESGDTCEFTVVIMTGHAVMLGSGFVLSNPDSCMRFSFSEETSVSLDYTLPSMISGNGTETVSLKFENLDQVVVYVSLSEDSLVGEVIIFLQMEEVDEDDSDDDEESEEEEETPKKPEPINKKRPNESASKASASGKKAKPAAAPAATPQKTEEKKKGGHTATPHPVNKIAV